MSIGNDAGKKKFAENYEEMARRIDGALEGTPGLLNSLREGAVRGRNSKERQRLGVGSMWL